MTKKMAVNGLFAEINTPEALIGEGLHSLPPHNRVDTHVVDEHPACPGIWEHGSGKASSYFLSLEAGKGMWFDFTSNQHHKHHVAVVTSVQGINPITGKPITELCLVQHKTKCPIHDMDFQQDRYCPKCKFKWPAQNYIATTYNEPLWIDGFRNDDGEVRQYIVSEEQARGVAKQIEDKDPKFKRVWAIGFAFYLSKEPKPETPLRLRSILPTTQPPEDGFYEKTSNWSSKSGGMPDMISGGGPDMLGFSASYSDSPSICSSSSSSKSSGISGQSCGISAQSRNISAKQKVTATKKLEIGAGARISQDIPVDQEPIDFWQEEPAGMIYVNFTDQETLQKILDAGCRQDKAEGPLDGLKVGN